MNGNNLISQTQFPVLCSVRNNRQFILLEMFVEFEEHDEMNFPFGTEVFKLQREQ